MTRPNLCFRDPSSNNVENDLGGTRLAGMKSNQEMDREVQMKNDHLLTDNSRRNEKDNTDGLQGRTL